MLARYFTLFALLIAMGCDTPTAQNRTTPETTTSQNAPTKMATVELIDAQLAPFKNAANGKMGQEVLTTWKNTGDISVRVVDAEITSLNDDGSTRETFNYTLFAEFDDSPGVLPGETHETEPGRGFKLPGFEGFAGYSPASSVKVRIAKVAEKSGM
ncbi:hypothetical protein [Aureliella helgolandensis]|uniref:DUF4352 domain-containing protein n=1 Tax=Aureliella helgolandensis TaxID=2527968 RepID=A0A518GBE7_9BACT|nr:hypothetical protein [Aureliella helgolandensis]QDV25867.1 hypothetical protein Q31a_41950 [Aureliella helgolandensis]